MNIRLRSGLLVAIGLSPLCAAVAGAQSPTLDLKLVPSGTFARVQGYRPYGLKLSSTPPPQLKRAPKTSSSLQYGTLHFGAGTDERDYVAAVEEPVGPHSRLYVDAEGDGDLSSATPVVWTTHSFKGHDGSDRQFFDASVTIDLLFRGKSVPCTVAVYPSGESGLGYYADFSLMGSITLAGVRYPAIYWDTPASWNPKNGATLMVDTDHDGKFHPGYEFFPSDKPFNIKGTTYELRSRNGLLVVSKSKESVKERTLADAVIDPNAANGLRPGRSAYEFEEPVMGGKQVDFPHSYSGKIVMLDFWATWCGPCMREAPNLAHVYAKYHDKGFDVLGVSLDNPNEQAAIGQTTKRVGMTWPQVYDGKAWEGSLVKKYGIKAIPAAYLVDGDTGKIIAMLGQLRGPALEKTISAALAKKSGSQ